VLKMEQNYSAMVTAPHSNTGKTIFTLLLGRALKKYGYYVKGFKVGPDYIDQGVLSRVIGDKVYNLDTILMKREDLDFIYHLSKGFRLIEGVMGFFDGVDLSFTGSSYEVAKKFKTNLIYLIDYEPSLTYYMTVIKGVEQFLKGDVRIGVVLNRIKNEEIIKKIEGYLNSYTNAKLIGFLPENEMFDIKNRHLGLYTGLEIDLAKIDKATDKFLEYIDIEKIVEFAKDENFYNNNIINNKKSDKKGFTKRCYIAYDRAFNFYYQNNIDKIIEAGYEIVRFSPLADEPVIDADLIYIGGGYPELYAKTLERNENTKGSIIEHFKKGFPIFCECGGLIYAGRKLYIDGKGYKMLNIFDIDFEFTGKLVSLGYFDGVTLKDSLFFGKGESIRGHQFRYSKIIESRDQPILQLKKISTSAVTTDGYLRNNCFGSYTHFNFSTFDILKQLG